ncbi:hypothetical protein [Ahrensia kielensis]|uniref:hypothetical protein n=1 Tax=Ahrensia kielensis TaxID=76980 RepID=UPI0003825A02|nr:hypothetical protein [Ahrensia kielensis]
MTHIPQNVADGNTNKMIASAWAMLIAIAIISVLLLILPTLVPIGAMYWDSYIYLDAEQRIATGQLPNVDFDAPAGPLDYYLVYLIRSILPDSQPMLAASWSMIIVTVPVMALIMWDVIKSKAWPITAIVVGFTLFTLIPFNTTPYYPFPGADGFAIYNRHGSQLLFVLVTALLFARRASVLIIAIATIMTALFLVKITAFAAGGLLCAWALFTGRVSIKIAALSSLLAAIVIAILELTTGIVSAYLNDLFILLTMNEGGLLGRILQGISRTFSACLFGGLLSLVLLFTMPRATPWKQKFQNPGLWIIVALIAGVFYESQNTGGQEMILLWPVVIFAFQKSIGEKTSPATFYTIIVLAAATLLPMTASILQASARATSTMVKQHALQHTTLRNMGAVTVRPDTQERTNAMRANWLAYPEALNDLALDKKRLPSFLLFSDLDYQVGWAQAADRVVAKLKRRQADGLDIKSITTLDFTNPFAWLLNINAPKYMPIGADPYRTVPEPDERTLQSLRDTDMILKPKCPFTNTIVRLHEIYAPALTEHKQVDITPCYSAFIHPRLQDSWK